MVEKCTETNDCMDVISAFDAFTTNNHMKILKMLLPYVDSKHQKILIMYIKFQEFMFTLNFFQYYSVNLYGPNFTQKKSSDIKNILPKVIPYCTENEKQLLNQFSQMQNMMQMMDGIKEYMPIIQQFMSSAGNEGNPSNDMGNSESFNLIDILKNMLSEEQMTMFSMFMDNNT